MPVRPAVLALAALALLLTGCSSGSPSASSSASPSASSSPSASPSPSATTTSAAPVVAPRVGSCHALTLAAATRPTDEEAPVPCSAAHTSVTIAVGRLTPLSDGHLLAMDSPAVQRQTAAACPRTLPAYVGGDRTAQRLSRLQVVAFTPTLAQADAGADWYRCDVVALRSQGQLLPLPASMKGVLGRPGALARLGTCGTAAPGSRGFQLVACSQRHSWRAVKDLPISASRYLDKGASARGDAACKAIASARAGGALKFSWSFEWPTQVEWRSGQRWGLCWLPGQ